MANPDALVSGAPDGVLLADALHRLRQLKGARPRGLTWPEGCYGSALSWLLFVGPSPGGKPVGGIKGTRRNTTGGGVRWNVPFDAPYAPRPHGWGRKYRANIPLLVSTIIGLPLERGADRLYGFANFDWIPSPKESDVSTTRMKRGERAVMEVMLKSRPVVIAPMTHTTFLRVMRCLKAAGYELHTPTTQKVRIRIDPKGKAHHWHMDAARLSGKGPLSGSVVVRLPQHPARMLYAGHGERCARAVRAAVVQLLTRRDELVADEV